MNPVTDERLEKLIAYAEQVDNKPWLCVEVVAALRELQERRASSPPTSSGEHTK